MLSSTDHDKLQQIIQEHPETEELFNRIFKSHQMDISTISHEIRNPLTLVYSTLQLIESQHPEVLEFAHWSELHQDIEYMKLLLEDLSSYNNGERLDLAPLSTGSFFRRIALSFASSIIDTDIEFTSYIPEDLPVLSADSVKLRQALLNLLRNAADAVRTESPSQDQHDMPEKELDSALGAVVESCVNAVGVDVNTASMPLLKQVSGLNATTAKNIVAYREENGAFTSRAQLKKVPKLGPKAFEQSAGFLRVPESAKVLDHTGVHPESYKAAEELLTRCGLKLADVGTQKLQELPARVKLYGEQKLAEDCAIGVPTMLDIVKELVKPGRDPRDELPAPILRTDVLELKDLKPGMELSGTVRNVIDFGVFVDIGVHQDGLVHISQVCSKFIKHPSEVVSVGDVVKVRVLEVDEKRKRISLTMKDV